MPLGDNLSHSQPCCSSEQTNRSWQIGWACSLVRALYQSVRITSACVKAVEPFLASIVVTNSTFIGRCFFQGGQKVDVSLQQRLVWVDVIMKFIVYTFRFHHQMAI